MDLMSAFEPAIQDDSGYRVRNIDLEFLGITHDSARLVVVKECPLGMDPPTYEIFFSMLADALDRQSVTDADVRIKGSSVRFFSGAHKEMPFDRQELKNLYQKSHGEPPQDECLDAIESRISLQWPESQQRPLRRMFDVMYRTGIDWQMSDYDIQISSNQIVNLVKRGLKLDDRDSDMSSIFHSTYDFVEKEYIDRFALEVSVWIDRVIDLVGRPVSAACFESSGPPPKTGMLSSHYRDDDWIVMKGSGFV
ncbi:hypothetical protein [Arthrobacter cavernae]|uniref:Uncharacterized protein n=1 Tax=Arthrobacter cavernae TaxID=2817681 RepID=A0A939HFH1_9MICC|nr:hypothetical protein [Arthrobacter cavernae]MBO1268941.1 hypothetical protein [Arthrobacter cavernae]